jgi:hypothetical protein
MTPPQVFVFVRVDVEIRRRRARRRRRRPPRRPVPVPVPVFEDDALSAGVTAENAMYCLPCGCFRLRR